MEEYIWFNHEEDTYRFWVEEGKLDIPPLAAHFNLNPDRLRIGKTILSAAGFRALLAELRRTDSECGKSEATAIKLEGQPAACCVSSGPDPVSILQDHFSTALSRLQPDESAAQQEQQRGGPIQPSDEGIVSNVGLRLGLAGYDATVDDVIRLLCHLCRKFRPDKPEQDWKADLQLLRVVGAPGIGKSTLLRHVWGLLRQRLAFVKTDQQQHSQQKWQQWEKLGVEQLQQRIEVCGSTPWVFVLDLSDMAKLLPGESQLVASSQLAVRMLYAVVREDFTSYDDFFAKLTRISPNLAEQLQPLHVMEFIQTATADASKPTLAVWAFDEVNAVQPTDLDPMGQDGTKVTFLQRQLSEAVLARQAAWLAMKKGRLNLLPVFITASTRGSASSLHSTESRKARSSDVRMALADDMSVKQLVVMDLFRRLPWPKGSERPTMPGPENSLSDLSDAERQQLLDCCPTAVTGVLHWVGSSYRLIEQSVLAMCGCHNGADLNVGNIDLCFKQDFSVMDVIKSLASTMADQHWSKYTTYRPDSLHHKLLQQVVAYSLTGRTVTRAQVLVEGGAYPIRVQDVEADGMVVLLHAGNLAARFVGNRRRRTSSDSACSEVRQSIEATAPPTICDSHMQQQHPTSSGASSQRLHVSAEANIAASYAGVKSAEAEWEVAAAYSEQGYCQPDVSQPLVMVMAPLMLAALQRNLDASTRPYVKVPLLAELADEWRDREVTDAETVALRMQLYHQVFNHSSMCLHDLHPGFYNTNCDVRICLPTDGYRVERHKGNLNLKRFEESVANATKNEQWLHLGPGQSGPGDSWLVLFECNRDEKLTGRKVVLHIQSKSSISMGTFSMQLLEEEVQKVPVLGGDILQAMLFISDKQPNKALKHALEQPGALLHKRSPRQHEQQPMKWNMHSSRSATATHKDGSIDVVIVTGEEQQSLRGAADFVRRLKQRLS